MEVAKNKKNRKNSEGKISAKRKKELNQLAQQYKAENPFHLPEDITFEKEQTSFGTIYNFRHRELGRLGRIVLQANMIGETHASIEIAGDPDDPITKKKEEIFAPVAMEMVNGIEKILGSGKTDTPAPERPPESSEEVLTKIHLCNYCEAKLALLIFSDDAIEEPELADYANGMYSMIKELNLQTWVIGPMLGDGPMENRPAPTLKVWPNREPLQLLTPDEFNPILEALSEDHCKQPASTKAKKQKMEGKKHKSQFKEEPQWKPLSFLPLIATIIDGDKDAGEEQYQSLLKVKDRPAVLDNALVNRIIRVHTEKLDNLWVLEEQLSRWEKEKLTKSQSKEINRLKKELEKSTETCKSVLELAENLKKNTLDEILKQSDPQVILDFFSGKFDLDTNQEE